jgi:hypothetical protein
MPLPNPPFPRRGIPSPKAPRLPRRREEDKPFFRTRQGYRLLFYGFLLLAFGGGMLGKLGQWKARQGGPESRSAAESRSVPLTSPPKAFVSSDIRHALITLEDFSPSPRPAAIALVLRSFRDVAGPESRLAPPEYVDLEVDESVAHPEAFRGGFVRTRGHLQGVETRGPEDALTYRSWLVVGGGRNPQLVVVETDTPPEFEKGEMLDAEGVFLQAVTYVDAKDRSRTTAFIAASSLKRTPPAEHPQSFRDKLFTPVAIFLIILILATTLFLVKKSRKSAPANRYVARPPGPGR